MDRLTAFLEDRTRRIRSARVIAAALVRGRAMGKLATVGERLRAMKEKNEQEGDRLIARIDELERRAPEIFARAHNGFDRHRADLDEMEKEIQILSNSFPLEDSSGG
jgi:transposase